MLDKYAAGGGYRVPLHEFMRAIIYGDGIHYDPSSSPLANVFDIGSSSRAEHFLLLAALDMLLREGVGSGRHGFTTLSILSEYLQSVGFVPMLVTATISRAAHTRLLETSGGLRPTAGESDAIAVRITPAGAYHLKRLPRMFTYLDAVIVDTPLVGTVEELEWCKDVQPIQSRLDRCDAFLQYLDDGWSELSGSLVALDWPAISADARADVARVRTRLVR